jgi:predicted acetyltransferase
LRTADRKCFIALFNRNKKAKAYWKAVKELNTDRSEELRKEIEEDLRNDTMLYGTDQDIAQWLDLLLKV